jgi:hypothetical protein
LAKDSIRVQTFVKFDLLVVNPINQVTENRSFNILQTHHLALTFNKLAVKCFFEEWRVVAESVFVYIEGFRVWRAADNDLNDGLGRALVVKVSSQTLYLALPNSLKDLVAYLTEGGLEFLEPLGVELGMLIFVRFQLVVQAEKWVRAR